MMISEAVAAVPTFVLTRRDKMGVPNGGMISYGRILSGSYRRP